MGAFRWIRELWLGRKQLGQKAENTVALPATTGNVNLFTVAGGRVLLTSLLGQVTVAPAGGGPPADLLTFLEHTPTTGVALVTPLCAALDILGDIIDTIYTITGGVGAPMVADAGVGVLPPSFGTNQLILQPGVVNLDMTEGVGGDGTVVGTIRWTVHYIPIDVGAVIIPA